MRSQRLYGQTDGQKARIPDEEYEYLILLEMLTPTSFILFIESRIPFPFTLLAMGIQSISLLILGNRIM